ncbi:hypothetical protein H2203_003271 [Taxawa tesnikishii (nom. ined.)]|nr:hypothetical protein H2203_003271 [Dothideales sp. JES 119]
MAGVTFSSSRNLSKLMESNGKSANEEAIEDEPQTARSRFFRDRASDNTQNRSSFGLGSKTNKDDRESWTAGRGKGVGDDEDRAKNGDNRERYFNRNQRDRSDNDDETFGRRNGFGQKTDNRWSRDGDRNAGRTQDRPGGWREREKQKNERDWDRSAPERDPEWMDEPAEKGDNKQAHTQEEFQRWKERMKAGNTQTGEKEVAATETEVESPAPAAKASSTTKTEGGLDKLFGSSWGEPKRSESVVEPLTQTPKAAPGKGKSSRFASLFAPKDVQQQAFNEPASPPTLPTMGNGSSEDKEAFQNILLKLKNSSLTPQTNMAHGLFSPVGEESNPLGFGAPLPEQKRDQSYPQSPQDPLRGLFGQKPGSGQPNTRPESGMLPPQPTSMEPFRHNSNVTSNAVSPEPLSANFPGLQPSESRAPQNVRSPFAGERPATHTPESLNIQNLIANQQQTQKPGGLNESSQFLLDLIKKQSGARPPSHQRQGGLAGEPDNFQLFLDQPPNAGKPQGPTGPVQAHSQAHTHAPKPRAPGPPGFLEDQFLLQQHERRENPQSYDTVGNNQQQRPRNSALLQASGRSSRTLVSWRSRASVVTPLSRLNSVDKAVTLAYFREVLRLTFLATTSNNCLRNFVAMALSSAVPAALLASLALVSISWVTMLVVLAASKSVSHLRLPASIPTFVTRQDSLTSRTSSSSRLQTHPQDRSSRHTCRDRVCPRRRTSGHVQHAAAAAAWLLWWDERSPWLQWSTRVQCAEWNARWHGEEPTRGDARRSTRRHDEESAGGYDAWRL